MPQAMYRGARVIWQGRTGTVTADYSENWQTAGIEFDDEKSVVIQKLKTELTVIPNAEPKNTLISLAEELETAAQYDNSDYSIRQTMDDVAARLRELALANIDEGVRVHRQEVIGEWSRD